MLIDDKEIWRCAYQVMRQYGDAATLHAAMRADELLAGNDFQGSETWIRILNRLEYLEITVAEGTLQ